MNAKNVIMNFSHVYEKEDFYHHAYFQWIDCTDLSGTSCYCTPQAANEIRRRILNCPVQGIHFLDSGDYHYVSKFWLEKIKQPFNLLLFDYHSDMQPPKFPELLSCGCWVKDAIDQNPMLQRVCIVGPDEQAFSGIETNYRCRLFCVSLQALQETETWGKMRNLKDGLPLYISIDKDVLNTYFARTDWSQGGLSLTVLEKLLALFETRCRVIGIDICGECKMDVQYLLARQNEEINNTTNLALLRFLLRNETIS
ncbi:MAG TPA: arginase [Ruminococcaceae bacterium]|nr:arginase [Oscillospiraceae bacterium]